ncbi:F-box only protein 25 isoform X6 [Eumetopias jubatus]|uniref:F-box only protein 25 isoform X6 n=1 Tax=Eumetopias jubatus TaxID=34886 RepID=UPI001016AAA5|nr:F-box only protein 25 isoform X6 [Eumetopias jubatus]
MPFLGQDWRSPGWSWIKTEDGWKRCESWSRDLERETNPRTISHSIILNSDDEEIFSNEEQEYTSKKRKKDHFRNDTDTQCFYREKWIYVHKESTRERHGYCTLGEAFNRLDFSSAIQDIRRFTYVVKQVNDGLTLSDLPLHMLNNILYRLSDGWDIVTLGQVTPTLSMLSEDRRLWKKLCQYHFAEKQTSDPVGEGPRGVEADVLRAPEALPAPGAVRGHPALLPSLQHPLLEGLGAPLHRHRSRQLLHARVTTALHRPVQVLKAPRPPPALPVEGVRRTVPSPRSDTNTDNTPPRSPPGHGRGVGLL